MKKSICVAASCVAFFGAGLHANALSLNEIQFWSGTGTNRAAMVIEWSSPEVLTNTSVPVPISTKSLAWGFRFNGNATAEDMFNAILATDPRLFAMVNSMDSTGKYLMALGYDLNNNRVLGIRNGTNMFSYSCLTNVNSFTNGLLKADYIMSDTYQPLDGADLYWGGSSGPGWELWTEQGGNGGFENAPIRSSATYWTPDDPANPWSGNDGQWHYADLGMGNLNLKDGSWIGWTVAAGGLDYMDMDSDCSTAWAFHKHAPAEPESVPGFISPYGATLTAASGPFSGSTLYADPTSVLGEPSTLFNNTAFGGGAGWRHIKIVEAAYNVDPDGAKMIVTLNQNQTNNVDYYGSVTIKFDHPVIHNPANPYGIDFEVFGNAFYVGSGFVSDTSDMRAFNLTGGVFSEDLLVSVSPDGVSWYSYKNGPYCDGVFPTQGYEWDSSLFDTDTNGWTQKKMDFTLPVDPYLTNLLGVEKMSTADALKYYGRSGGGAGFSLAESGFNSIQYVRIEATEDIGSGGEVDAITDVRPAVLGEPLVIGPDNISNNNSQLFFQEPGTESNNVITVTFKNLTNYAVVTPLRLSSVENKIYPAGKILDIVQVNVAPVIVDNPISFETSVALNLSSKHSGTGSNLDVYQWDGTNWNRTKFSYSNGTVELSQVTGSITFAATEITVPQLTVTYDSKTGNLSFEFTALAGWTHVLERTTDFSTWTSVETETPVLSQEIRWTDSASDARAFYRLRLIRP